MPSDVAGVLATALAQKPADRYATAGEMAEALTKIAKGEWDTPQLETSRPETGQVSSPILTTKLYIPPTRPELVSRSRLIERLNEGLHRKLTLVSAPAGFGKTTLVSDWLRQLDVPTAWISLDESDQDPVRFLTYVVAALRTIEANIGNGALSALRSPQPPPTEAVLTSLLNEIVPLSDRIILVLDDYHLIEAQPIHGAITFLLEHLPLQMHLVIATREDPPLPLARLRARDQMTELRAMDLRFTSSEAAKFLNQAMGLNLSAEDIATLETRTEGWITGLQLVAISMQGHEDTTNFIKSFTGSHHYVLDYLIEEVLERQSESVQTFLLKTSILDRLTGSLCDALTCQDNGQATLEMLEHANLFIIPLDNERHWYRYHHLFTDLLRRRLSQTQLEQVPILQTQASEWYEQNGFADEAIVHALRAADFRRAAYLIEEQAEAIWGRGEHTKLWGWLKTLPADQVAARPRLCIFRAWVLFANGQQQAAEQSLQIAEQALDSSPTGSVEASPEDSGPPSDSNKMTLQGRVAAIRAFIASFRGDAPEIIQYSRRALEYLPEQDSVWRSSAAIVLGDAYSFNGEMATAYQARLEALQASKTANNIYLILIASLKLAITLRQRGQLQRGVEICQQQSQLVAESGLSKTAMVGSLFAVWGEILGEWNDLDLAVDYVKKGAELSEQGHDVAALGWSYLCLVRILFSRGEMANAEKVIHKMEKIDRESDVPPWITNLMAAWQVRIWLAQGKLEAASQWVQERGLTLSLDGELPFLREVEYLVLARTLMAQDRFEEAQRLLDRLVEAAEAGGRTTRVIEMLILQALAFQAGDNTDRAMARLEQALTLAEPGGYIRIFVDEGPPMAELLTRMKEEGGTLRVKKYIRKLLAAFEEKEFHPFGSAQDKPSSFSPQPLVEPLSERELEVLQLLAEGLTNPEIATKIFLSLNTVKVHTRNIYGKLDAHNRTQAVARARALGLLSSISHSDA